VSVFSGESERSREFVVELVNVLVDRSGGRKREMSEDQERSEERVDLPVVEKSVREVVPCVFENEEECDL